MVERAVVDLELRYGLDSGSFAKVLGLSPQRASELSRNVATTWAETLDPAVLAWLGPGACDSLAGVLTQATLWPRSPESALVSSVDTTGPIPIIDGSAVAEFVEPLDVGVALITVGALVDAAPAVMSHVNECDICGPRLRLLTPVRTLLGQVAVEPVPRSVATAARAARRRLPAALPPSIEPRRFDVARLTTPLIAIGALVVVLGAGFGIAHAVTTSHDSSDSQKARVQQLVRNTPVASLLATPSIMTPGASSASLANTSSKVVTWTAAASASWVTVSPSSGHLNPSQSVSVIVHATVPSQGATDATITFTGSDGATQTIRYDGSGG